MRKLLILGLFCFFLVGMAYGEGIIVSEPTGGIKNVSSGAALQIQWIYGQGLAGSPAPTVDIYLYKNQNLNTPFQTIASGVSSSSGSYSWPLPSSVDTGSYRIRVQTSRNSSVGGWTAIFNLQIVSQSGLVQKAAPAPQRLVSQPAMPRTPTQRDFFIKSMYMSPGQPEAFTKTNFIAVLKNIAPETISPSKAELKVYRPDSQASMHIFDIPAIPPNGSHTITQEFIMRKSGLYRNELTIDKTDAVRNENETNNTRSQEYDVRPFQYNYTPDVVDVRLDHTRGDKDFKSHGPAVNFRAMIFISQDGSKILVEYSMNAKELGPDFTTGEAKGSKILRTLFDDDAVYRSFGGGWKTYVIVENFVFGLGEASDRSHWITIPEADPSSIGQGKRHLVRRLEFTGNRAGDDWPRVGFNIIFNEIELVIDGR